jgi:hypothetical protein
MTIDAWPPPGDMWGAWAAASGNSWTSAVSNYTSLESASLTVYPAAVAVPSPPPEPVDEGPLSWLRGSVKEITELAFAA